MIANEMYTEFTHKYLKTLQVLSTVVTIITIYRPDRSPENKF